MKYGQRTMVVLLMALVLLLPGAAQAQAVSEPAGTAMSGATQNATTADPAALAGASVNATAAPAADGDVHTLDAVEVQDERKESGRTTIGGQALQSLPSHTGSITEALKGMPNVQFGYEENSSQTTGEIRPPRISIAGAKPYENNFLIDGLSVSNNLNPNGLSGDGNAASHNSLHVNGADQTIFYDTSLVDNITVYTNNVPAKYGSFVGGVVSADLRDPRQDRWHGMVQAKHTRNKWYNLRGVDEDSEQADSQPRFSIYNLTASADGPLTDTTALLLSVSRNESTIPLKLEENDGTFHDQDQYRINDNFFVKTMLNPSDDLKFTLDATYAPYVEKRWRATWPDSDWKIVNNSYRFGGKAEIDTDLGLWTGKAAYSGNGFSRDGANTYRYSRTDSRTAGALPKLSYGSTGDAEVENRSFDFGLDFDSKDLDWGQTVWNLSSGVVMNTTTTDAWNEAAQVDTLVINNTRQILTQASYEEVEQSKSLTTLGYYGQAEIEWKRLTLTPGFRIDYDDFSNNKDIAPRFKAEVDTLGDGSLRVVGGLNRYYGGQLRAYAFKRYRPYQTHQETTVFSTGITTIKDTTGTGKQYDGTGVNTPYSDEVSAGLLGEVLGFEYSLEGVHRNHRDQLISKTKDGKDYYMTNDGKSDYDGLTMTLSRAVATERTGTHTFALGATISRTKTVNGSYYSEDDVDQVTSGYIYNYDRVFYNGNLISRADLPAEDYNAPLVLTFTWTGSFMEDRLRLNSVTRWRDSSDGLTFDKRYSKDTPYGTTSGSNTSTSYNWIGDTGEYHAAYASGIITGGMVSDLSLEWDAVKQDLYTVTLLFDVLNVFDANTETSATESSTTNNYGRGRGFYAGVRCTF